MNLVENKKPAPDLYELVLEKYKDAKGIVAIEDSVVGVKAAKAAGLTCYAYAGVSRDADKLSSALKANGADKVFNDYFTFRI